MLVTRAVRVQATCIALTIRKATPDRTRMPPEASGTASAARRSPGRNKHREQDEVDLGIDRVRRPRVQAQAPQTPA